MKKHNVIFACSFFFSLGGNILNFSLVYLLADKFSFNPGQIGSFIALGQFSYFLGCNLYHRFGSAFNPVKVFSLSSVLTFLASISLGHGNARFLVYGSYWLLQTSIGFFWPPVMAWLTAGLNEKELNKKISVFNRSWMAAQILGPLIAGPLYRWNSGINFFLVNISYASAVALLFLVRHYAKDGGNDAARVPSADHSAGSRERTAPNRPLDKRLDLYRYRGWLNGFISSIFAGVLINILPLYIRDGLGYTERAAGLILFMRCAAGFAGFILLARFTFWHFNRRWFAVLQGALVFAALLLIPAGHRLFIYFFIAVYYGFVHAGCYTNSIFYSGATGENRKKNMAVHEIAMAVGNALGTAGGGFIFQRFRFTGTCFALTLIMTLGFGLIVVLNRKEHPARG